jgi:hypothetical protein
MWIMLFLLWIIPITLGIIAFVRVIDGMPALKANERKLLFDETKETEFGVWLAITFAALAVAFFMLGLVQGIILPNLSGFWLVIVPLLTGSAAVIILVLWLRSSPPQFQGFQNRISRMHTRAARMADTLFR